MAVTITYIPTKGIEVFLFHTASPAFVVVVIDDNHSDWS
jgi:hypothetical protein